MRKQDTPLRVVLFTGGAVLEDDCLDFVARLMERPEIELAGVFCEARTSGGMGVVRDLWRRRGLLAPLLLVQRALRRLVRTVAAPRVELHRRRARRRLGERLHYVRDLHADAVLAAVAELEPGLGAVYGGPVLRPALFALPTRGTLGIHHGLLPEYRGKKTTFWAMYNGEDRVGVAVQKIGAGLDSGDLLREATLATGRTPPPLVNRRLHRLGLDLYVDAILSVYRGTDSYRPQPAGTGRLYHDPDGGDIVRFWLRYLGRLAGPQLAARTPRMTGGDDPRVCILTETYYPVTGGGETQARALAEGFAAEGIRVHLITRRSDRALVSRQVLGNVTIHRVGPAGKGHLRKWGMLATALVRLLRARKQYDLMLVCGFRVLGVPALIAGALLGRPSVLKADSQGEMSGAFFDPGLARLHLRHDRFPVRFALRMRNALLRRAARFVAISEVIQTEYVEAGIPWPRIVRIPNSTDPAVFCPVGPGAKAALRKRLGISADRPVVTYTGRLVTTKGLPSLLRAWRTVLVARPDALLMLVGSGGLGLQNCEAALRQYASEHALQSAVLFTGSVDNVHEYLQASDVFVFPTRREAFGISVIEAMACGLPIVTTRVDGIRDIVRPDVDALVVTPGDDNALATALGRALAGSPAIAAMAAEARERAVQAYSSHSVIEAYRRVFDEIPG